MHLHFSGMKYSVCVCVYDEYLLMWIQICPYYGGCMAVRGQTRVLVLAFHLFEIGFHCCSSKLHSLTSQFTSKNFPSSASLLSVEALDLQTCIVLPGFMRVLGITTLVLTLPPQVVYPLSHLCSHLIILFALESLGSWWSHWSWAFCCAKRLTWVWKWAEGFLENYMGLSLLRYRWWMDREEDTSCEVWGSRQEGDCVGKLRTLVQKKWKTTEGF